METYNELLKEFHQQVTPKTFTPYYKSLYDEVKLSKARKKDTLISKQSQLKHLAFDASQHILCSSRSMITLNSNSRVTTSKIEERSIGQDQLQKQYSHLEQEIKALKIKTHQINHFLSLYAKKQPCFEEINKANTFSVFNHCEQLNIQTNLYSSEEIREQQILHDLKAKKQRINQEIQELIKNKQKTDNIKKRLRRVKQIKVVNPVKQYGLQVPQFQSMLRTFYMLYQMQEKHEKTISIQIQQIKEQYERKQKFKSNCKAILIKQHINTGQLYDDNTVRKIVQFYHTLQVELDRNQRAYQQFSNTHHNLQNNIQKLEANLHRIRLKGEQKSFTTLQNYFIQIQAFEHIFSTNCNKINKFTTQIYELLRKINSFFHTLEHVLQQTEAGKKIHNIFPDCYVLKRYEELFYRNPEAAMLQIHTSPLFQNQIKNNSLLRMYFIPQNYSKKLQLAENYERLITISLKNANQFISQMFHSISEFFRLAKPAIEITSKPGKSEKYCIESKDYHRRDNYKILQKMQKQQLKKRGLIMNVPLNWMPDTQINQNQQESKSYLSSISHTPRCTSFSRIALKYTDLATKREENNLRKQKIRKMFGRLDSISRSSNKFSISQRKLQSSRLSTNISSANLSQIYDKIIRKTRRTVGNLSKQILRTQKTQVYY